MKPEGLEMSRIKAKKGERREKRKRKKGERGKGHIFFNCSQVLKGYYIYI